MGYLGMGWGMSPPKADREVPFSTTASNHAGKAEDGISHLSSVVVVHDLDFIVSASCIVPVCFILSTRLRQQNPFRKTS